MVVQDIFQGAKWNDRMEALRVLKGLTRHEFADLIGTGYWLYNEWANGKHYPIPINRKAIARVLDVTEETIFG
jgi:transcriptional regulator with XRE-family HTH domain